jgi:uncharacterized protein (DUF1800 family)
MQRSTRLMVASLLALALAACGGSNPPPPVASAAAAPDPSLSSGQVAPRPAAPLASFYAASRLAEQASFGPTPALVAEIQAKGIERWVDEQLALPASQIDLTPFLVANPGPEDWNNHRAAWVELMVASPDPLRQRVAWVLAQSIVLDTQYGDPLGRITFQNTLLRGALGTFGDLLYSISTHPWTGDALGLTRNRPRQDTDNRQAPSEHYARLLIEQYTLGPWRLHDDARVQRDLRGRPQASHSQADVEELARALTGWYHDPDYGGQARLPRDWGNWRRPLVASFFPGERDFGAKRLLGSPFTEFQTAQEDLRQAIDVLTAQSNAAPYLALRLIQGLVKSQPSADYVRRVAAVVRNNGQGARGDLKAVVKAVLMDSEARAGDEPARARPDDGRMREPLLAAVAFFRAMGCQRLPRNQWGPYIPQEVFGPEGIGWSSPWDRSAASEVASPEQRLLTAEHFNGNAVQFARWLHFYEANGRLNDTIATNAGCPLASSYGLYARSPAEFLRWMGDRFFRGALPPALRQDLELLMRATPWNPSLPYDPPSGLLSLALVSPDWGVIE